MNKLEWTKRQLARANARIAELEQPRSERLRCDIRRGVHPIVLMISHDLDVHDLLSELCFMAGVTAPFPSVPNASWQRWLPYFATRSLL
jgi:hypothetical protein